MIEYAPRVALYGSVLLVAFLAYRYASDKGMRTSSVVVTTMFLTGLYAIIFLPLLIGAISAI